jgi:benzodiazapine receptor
MKNYILTLCVLLQAGSSHGFQSPSLNKSLNLQHKLSNSEIAGVAFSQNQRQVQQQQQRTFSATLKASTSPSTSNEVVDVEAIAKYGSAAIVQLSLISTFLYGIDQVLALTGLSLPTPATWLLCFAFSLKSRTFNPLDNKRPNREKAVSEGESDGFKDRIQPSWTPPGVVFPIMWVLIIAPLRATSSTIILQNSEHYLSLPFMYLMLHLTCGDVWNTINNTEKRFGTSVVGVSAVYASAVFASYQYYLADPLAGKLLGATTIWLTIASALIVQIWRLNPDDDGEKDSLLPMRIEGEESRTQFSWFSNNKTE